MYLVLFSLLIYVFLFNLEFLLRERCNLISYLLSYPFFKCAYPSDREKKKKGCVQRRNERDGKEKRSLKEKALLNFRLE